MNPSVLFASIVVLPMLLAHPPSQSGWSQVSSIGAAPRYFHKMAYDPSSGRALLFGGVGSSYFGDTWEWDGSTWTLASNVGPSPRVELTMVYDSMRGKIVLFGGIGSPFVRFADTWE